MTNAKPMAFPVTVLVFSHYITKDDNFQNSPVAGRTRDKQENSRNGDHTVYLNSSD